jgi:hypothetical protein
MAKISSHNDYIYTEFNLDNSFRLINSNKYTKISKTSALVAFGSSEADRNSAQN